jgi:DNA-binding transcriptional regulator LsrR (DeoR family)
MSAHDAMADPGMLSLESGHESDDALRVRAAWLYYVGDLNQAETAQRLGITRARANKLIAEARERGLVTITVNDDAASTQALETEIAQRHGLGLCIVTPLLGLTTGVKDAATREAQGQIARRAVGIAAASFLKGKLLSGRPLTVGIGWGRTMEQMALHLAGVRNPQARFVSLLGSLTRNSASNPFEVVQTLATRTGGEGHFLPVPFVADSAVDRDVLMSQRVVVDALQVARSADLNIASLGELGAQSLVRRQRMLSAAEIASVQAAGGMADLLGRFFNPQGGIVEHELNRRTAAPDLADIAHVPLILLCAGIEKVQAVAAVLNSGLVHGLVIDGDTALRLLESIR